MSKTRITIERSKRSSKNLVVKHLAKLETALWIGPVLTVAKSFRFETAFRLSLKLVGLKSFPQLETAFPTGTDFTLKKSLPFETAFRIGLGSNKTLRLNCLLFAALVVTCTTMGCNRNPKFIPAPVVNRAVEVVAVP